MSGGEGSPIPDDPREARRYFCIFVKTAADGLRARLSISPSLLSAIRDGELSFTPDDTYMELHMFDMRARSKGELNYQLAQVELVPYVDDWDGSEAPEFDADNSPPMLGAAG